MCYQLWTFKLDTLIINHFIIENNLYGIVTRLSLRLVPWRSTTSLFFSVTLYTFILFWLGIQKSNTNLNNLFFMNIKFDEMLSEIGNVFAKKETLIYLCQRTTLEEFSFSYIRATPRKTLRNNATKWLTARITDIKHFSPLCLSTLSHGKHVIWTC